MDMEGLWEHVAQLVEQRTFNAWVLGSIPSELTTPQAANPSRISLAKLRVDYAVGRSGGGMLARNCPAKAWLYSSSSEATRWEFADRTIMPAWWSFRMR